jgi:ElaA protein
VALLWSWQRFQALDIDAVYDMLALRAKVFVLEQGPYLDPDGADRQAWHVFGRDAGGELLAYLRIVDPGVKFDEPSIGRVVVERTVRGQGHGHALMVQGVSRCNAVWPGRPIWMSAQAHLQRYYQHHGFETVGDEYLEDDIAHVHMRRSAR